MLLFSGSHVYQMGMGQGQKPWASLLPRVWIRSSTYPTPASSELHRPQPLGQPVRFSKQEKLKVDPPRKKV